MVVKECVIKTEIYRTNFLYLIVNYLKFLLYVNLDECSICYENMENSGIITLNCGHTFHKTCISKIMNKVCPLCRKPIFSEKY